MLMVRMAVVVVRMVLVVYDRDGRDAGGGGDGDVRADVGECDARGGGGVADIGDVGDVGGDCE